jgi:hypothetical protein
MQLKKWISWKELSFLLIPLFFLLHEWNARFAVMRSSEFFHFIWQYALASILIYAVLRLLIKSRQKAWWICITTIFFFLFFGTLQDAAKTISEKLTHFKYFFSLSFIVYGVIIFLILRSKKQRQRLMSFFLLLMTVYIGFELFQLYKNSNPAAVNTFFPDEKVTVEKKPDIYLLVMDEYASTKALKQYWNYDNSKFDSFLLKNNFNLIQHSRSNYNFTIFSMASVLGMNYIPRSDLNFVNRKNYYSAFQYIYSSAVPSFLESQGYAIENYSYFNMKGHPYKLGSKFLPFGFRTIYNQTFAGRAQIAIEKRLGKRPWQSDDYFWPFYDLTYKFKVIKGQVVSNGHPRFLYMHVFAPHLPFFTDSAGKLKPAEMIYNESKARNIKAYTDFLAYSNSLLEDLIFSINKQTKGEAVIILMGDHGFRKKEVRSPGNEHQFMNMLAVHLPVSSKDTLPQINTLVNLFPAVLNTSLKTHFPYRKDSTILSVPDKSF